MPDAPSPTPLHRKLGLKDDMRVLLIDPPVAYGLLLGPSPPNFTVLALDDAPFDLIHCFVTARARLEQSIPFLRMQIHPSGTIWISWPKRTSKVVTDITEDVVREVALSHDLVDTKVCAIDATWSALKLVIPLSLRARPR